MFKFSVVTPVDDAACVVIGAGANGLMYCAEA